VKLTITKYQRLKETATARLLIESCMASYERYNTYHILCHIPPSYSLPLPLFFSKNENNFKRTLSARGYLYLPRRTQQMFYPAYQTRISRLWSKLVLTPSGRHCFDLVKTLKDDDMLKVQRLGVFRVVSEPQILHFLHLVASVLLFDKAQSV
jgi:hypothetical protein